jgi:hypothetical protein
MASNFKSMKSSSQSEFSELTKKLNALNESQFRKDDETFWQPTVDKAGNGFAIIRFLPRVEGEDLPFVRYWDHGFKGPGGWYIELSRTSLRNSDGSTEDDPVTEYNNLRWAEGENSPGRAFVSGSDGKPGSKRRLHYISNIYVVDDPAEPKNNGTVRRYRYGIKVFGKVQNKMNPKYPGEVAFNPFDLWTGANFRLKIQKVEGQRNYDESQFDAPAPLNADDKVMEKVFLSQLPLRPLVDPSLFKSYAELKRKLDRVLNIRAGGNGSAAVETVEQEDAIPNQAHAQKTRAPAPIEEEAPPWETNDADDDLTPFQKLAAS